MNILVTGGTGFVGRHLVTALLAEGRHRVHLLVRESARLEACAFKDAVAVVRGDLFASDPIPADIEMVFHLAAATKALTPGEFTRVNVEGTRALLERLRTLKNLKRVILLSSLAAAGPNRGRAVLSEDFPAEPISLYGRSKLAQEEIVASQCQAPRIVIRAPIVFGPWDMDMLDLFRIANRGVIPLLGHTQRWYSLIFVKDLVRGMITAAFSSCGNEIFYVANPEAVEWRALMEQAALLLGKKKTRTIVVPEVLGRVLAEFSEFRIRVFGNKAIFNRDKFNEMKFPAWVCSAAKIDALLHFQPRVPLAVALAETITWYRERSLL